MTVRRLMELAAAEGGVAQFDRTAVDFEALVAEVADLYREIGEAKEVTVAIASEPDSIALVDRDAMRRVISNLLDNAIKYTPEGSRVDMQLRRNGTMIELQVSDSGSGIAAEDLPHIWSKLFRAHGSSALPGSGLGLSIVKAIVEAHGGTVDARSVPGQGAVFTVRVPIAE